jgi:hypothetical protein
MQLDKTAIAISQRNLDELLDLSLSVLRRYGLKLLGVALLSALPFAIINALLLSSRIMSGGYILDSADRAIFVLWMAVLVYVESPLAMAPVTIVLGNMMFGIASKKGDLRGTFRKQWFPILWIMSLLRGVIPMIGIIFLIEFVSNDRSFATGIGTFWICLMLLLVFLIRGFRPFTPEILLLEKCPWSSGKKTGKKQDPSKSTITHAQRSARIHLNGGELLLATIWVGFVALFFLGLLIVSSVTLIGSVTGAWTWGWWMDLFFYPLALWLISFWGTVVRFLLYMNTRIRGEGWELELKLKAEARRFLESKERHLA